MANPPLDNPPLDTASQRPATGFDQSSRTLIARAAGLDGAAVVDALFEGQFGDTDDYLAAVGAVWGQGYADQMRLDIERASQSAGLPFTGAARRVSEVAVWNAVMFGMPEPDFRTAVSRAIRRRPAQDVLEASQAVTEACRNRGIPWEMNPDGNFEWTGDTTIEAVAMRPASSALDDPRLAQVKSEFDSAQAELGLASPVALSKSVHQSACAVESAMKVLLDSTGTAFDATDAAFKLFDGLVDAGIVPREMDNIVLGAARLRNRRGGHGAGSQPHDVSEAMAESCLASSAVAITYLRSRLP